MDNPPRRLATRGGKATLVRGAKAGTYSITVKVTSAAKGVYAKGAKSFKMTFRVTA